MCSCARGLVLRCGTRERGVDGVCVADVPPPKMAGGSPALCRTTGRDTKIKIMAMMPREPVKLNTTVICIEYSIVL